jgi:opacity protein-like surface antigen
MRLIVSVLAIAAMSAVSVADAAPRKKAVAQRSLPPGSTVFTSQDESGRVRTKIMVQKRSYLDGGTEVMPGTYAPANATFFHGQRPSDGLGKNSITNPLGPIPDPWFLPGKNNPWHWFGN